MSTPQHAFVPPAAAPGLWKGTLRIAMLSDWGVGTGTGRPGDLDRLIRRDADELPLLPAKSLIGIWRDACEAMASALDEGQERGWGRLVELLFGTQPNQPDSASGLAGEGAPLEARLELREARLPASLCRAIGARTAGAAGKPFRDVLTIEKPELAIDHDSGTAKAQALRFIELARGGVELEAAFLLDLQDLAEAQREAAWALLIAGARFAERIGGKRRRGAGRLRLELLDAGAEAAALTWLEANEHVPPLAPGPVAPSAGGAGVGAADAGWVTIDLTLTLQTPVSIAERTTGNIGTGRDHLPGTHLLSRLSALLREAGLDPLALIGAERVRVQNAYLEVEGVRGLPMPLALERPKDRGAAGRVLFNRLREAVPEGVQSKGLERGWVALIDGGKAQWATLVHREVPRVLLTHTTVDDEMQRPEPGPAGSVYSYEAVAAGTVLRGRMLLSDQVAGELGGRMPDWRERLAGTVRVGRSKKDDYGLCALEVSDGSLDRCKPDPEHRLTVWCVSDVLVLDNELAPDPTVKGLRRAVEAELHAAGASAAELKPALMPHVLWQRRIEGWQRRWGLPRSSLFAIQAGSCAVLEVAAGAEQLTEDVLSRVQTAGLGERRAEGFGEIQLNHPLLTAALDGMGYVEPRAEDEVAGTVTPVGKADAAFDIACVLEEEAWRRAIERAVLLLAADPGWRRDLLGLVGETPPMSQLGALVQALDRRPDPAAGIREWLGRLEHVPRRAEKWKNDAGTLESVRKLAEPADSVTALAEHPLWRALEQPPASIPHVGLRFPPTITGATADAWRLELHGFALTASIRATVTAHKRALNLSRAGQGR